MVLIPISESFMGLLGLRIREMENTSVIRIFIALKQMIICQVKMKPIVILIRDS